MSGTVIPGGPRVPAELVTDAGVNVELDAHVVVHSARTIDFEGAGVSVTNDAGVAVVTIPGGGSGITVDQDSAPVVPVATTLNFTGNGVEVTNTGIGVATIGIAGGGSALAIEENGETIVAAATHVNFTGSGVTVTDAGGGTAHVAVTSGSAQFLNMLDFGANGADPAFDNAPAFTAGLTAAGVAGQPIIIPKGRYTIDSTVVIPTTVGLTVMGEQCTVVFNSTAFPGWQLSVNSQSVTITSVGFEGDPSTDKTINIYPGIILFDNCTDITVERCRFSQCNPLSSNDSSKTSRLNFLFNDCHNCSGGVHPPSHSLLQGNKFHCDSIIGGPHGRAQAIYCFGQFVDVAIIGNTFINIAEEDIQIRSGNANFQQRENFRIIGNHFENSNQYSIWCGSDENATIGSLIVQGNTFRNVSSMIQAQGNRSCVIDGNHAEWDWEFGQSLAPNDGASAITVVGGIGAAGAWDSNVGCVISNNKLLQIHPFFGLATLNSVPTAGDTITVGDFVYTWRSSAAVPGEITIGTGANAIRDSVGNLVGAVQAQDGINVTPSNALRFTTDAFNNFFAIQDGETNNNIAVIVGRDTFALSATGSAVAITAVVDNRQSCGIAITAAKMLNPSITDNQIDDFSHGIQLDRCYQPFLDGNTWAGWTSQQTMLIAAGNVRSYYGRGNRAVLRDYLIQANPRNTAFISDAFPTIDMSLVCDQQLVNPICMGRYGIVPIGNGKAYTLISFGHEVLGVVDSSTLAYRWEDGDEVFLDNTIGTSISFKFKRTAPGALQFNDADSLIALVNATATWTAAYTPIVNDLASPNPKMMITIAAAAGGVAGNLYQLWVTRYKQPGSADYNAAKRTTQPLLTGTILRARTPIAMEDWTRFGGGAATLIKTWVMSPIASSSSSVTVVGVDAASNGLHPVVYGSDIVPGVGFTITHDADTTGGAARFSYHINT